MHVIITHLKPALHYFEYKLVRDIVCDVLQNRNMFKYVFHAQITNYCLSYIGIKKNTTISMYLKSYSIYKIKLVVGTEHLKLMQIEGKMLLPKFA